MSPGWYAARVGCRQEGTLAWWDIARKVCRQEGRRLLSAATKARCLTVYFLLRPAAVDMVRLLLRLDDDYNVTVADWDGNRSTVDAVLVPIDVAPTLTSVVLIRELGTNCTATVLCSADAPVFRSDVRPPPPDDYAVAEVVMLVDEWFSTEKTYVNLLGEFDEDPDDPADATTTRMLRTVLTWLYTHGDDADDALAVVTIRPSTCELDTQPMHYTITDAGGNVVFAK